MMLVNPDKNLAFGRKNTIENWNHEYCKLLLWTYHKNVLSCLCKYPALHTFIDNGSFLSPKQELTTCQKRWFLKQNVLWNNWMRKEILTIMLT